MARKEVIYMYIYKPFMSISYILKIDFKPITKL